MSEVQQYNAPSGLPLWGGIECTHNRVGDRYFDQIHSTGHDRRPGDLALIAELGIRTLRYPALWEWAATDRPDRFHWSWCDERIEMLRKMAINPIVGFVHHGSGPSSTSLVDPTFVTGLTTYARAFAQRFPWVRDYTPVNEPLTTARFSALYGFWYPHLKNDRAFATAILNQCRAVVSAMKAIREVQPEARLIQTEDFGKTFSGESLQYQADFDNERRWLTYDLLCGKVDHHHPVGSFFLWLGIKKNQLDWFRENPSPPDIIGMNHYVTSDRFLDDRLDRYPAELWGGNGRHTYVDVEAVRVRAEGIEGISSHLEELWSRYQLPLAITETHLGCSREEQLRWLCEVWEAANKSLQRGVDVRAVTVWSLLGSYDWDSLVTLQRGHYECGAFDVRSGTPRPTALAKMVKHLAAGGEAEMPVLRQPGWWRRQCQTNDHNGIGRIDHGSEPSANTPTSEPLLITGATGTLGKAFARECEKRGIQFALLSRAELDIANVDSVKSTFERLKPWALINAAGYVRVDEAECDGERCWRENVEGPLVLARECDRAGVALMSFSSDLVFDGMQRRPYHESDLVNPLNLYGKTKAEAERRVTEICKDALLIRTSAFFDNDDEFNFPTIALRALSEGSRFKAVSDAVISPTFVPDLVHHCLDLLMDGASGIWHLSNQGELTWAEFAQSVAQTAGLDSDLIDARPLETFHWRAKRPLYSALGSERGILLPPLQDAISRFSRKWVERRPFVSPVPELNAIFDENDVPV